MFTSYFPASLHEKWWILGINSDHLFSCIGGSRRWTSKHKFVVGSIFKSPVWHNYCKRNTKIIDKKIQTLSTEKTKEDLLAEEQEITRRPLLSACSVVFLTASISALLLGPRPADQSGMAAEGDFPEYGPGKIPGEKVMQGSPFTAKLLRPAKNPNESDELEEVLSVKLKLFRDKAYGLNVFIGLPNATEGTPVTCSEYAGPFYHEARRVNKPEQTFQETSFRMGIGDVLEELGITELQSILVTLVPTGANQNVPITIEEMKIELD